MSAAPAAARPPAGRTPCGSTRRRPAGRRPAAAALRQLGQGRARLLGVLQAEPAQTPPACRAAWSTSQPPLASTLIRPPGPSASRTAATRSMSSRRRLPRLGDLHLRGAAARAARRSRARQLGSDGRHGDVHADRSADRLRPAGRRPTRSRWPATWRSRAGPYSANGENSPQPAGPCSSAPSRTVMPRNRLRSGIANARSVGSSPSRSSRCAGPDRAGLTALGHGRRGNLAKSGARRST